MSSLVLGFQEIEKTQLFLVGGKGLKLGELSKIHGIQVPEGFCVTTEAYQKAFDTGVREEVSFDNQKKEMVQWKFINISELIYLNQLTDGAESYSRINEVEDANAYTSFVHKKADSIKQGQINQILNFI